MRVQRSVASFVLCACAALWMGARAAHAAVSTLNLGIVQRAADSRLDPARLALAYPGQPGGRARDAVDMAILESQFALAAASLQVTVSVRDATSAHAAATELRQLERAGAHAILLDLPAAWMASATTASELPLINVGESADAPRQSICRANLFHSLPSERMRADAVAQALLSRKWQRVLLLAGPRPDDTAGVTAAQAALKRYGLKLVATKGFRLSSDPRERDLANPLLLTGPAAAGSDYDAVWVVDSDGEFARTLPYRTALPRPVVGDAGLMALAWAPHFERYGAPQLARRFARAAHRPMTSHDWAAYIATKAVLQAVVSGASRLSPAALRSTLSRPDFTLDGVKGVALSFRSWDHQLRQPMLLTDGLAVLGMAPVDGILHASDVLDTLGTDAPESTCRLAP